MTKYTRLTGKVFGSSATATGDDPEIGQFGSALAGTYNGTTDVSLIQSLPAWQKGFIGCVTPTTQFPPLPEMTGFGKVLSHQICYLLQQGVPEYDSGTTYYIGNWCSYNNSLYIAKDDGFSNIAPTDTTKWDKFTGGFSRNYGEIVTSSLPITDPTLHLADGSLLSATNYPEFVSFVANLYNSLPSGDFSTPVQESHLSTQSDWKCVAYGNNIWVAISYGSAPNSKLSTSTDGETWTTPTNLTSSTLWEIVGVTYGKNKFVCITIDGIVLTSSDGTAWTRINPSASTLGSHDWQSIAFGNGKFIALGASGYISTSTDGETWTTPTAPLEIASTINWNYINSDDNIFFIISSGGKVATSEDGASWSVYSSALSNSYTWKSIVYGVNNYVAISQNGYISTSDNLSSWTSPSSLLGNNNWIAASSGDNKIIAIGKTGYISKKEIPNTGVFATEADWQTSYTTYGECGKYVYNSSANTVRIPLYNSYFTNTVNPQNLGTLTEASLPNIKGAFNHETTGGTATGAFSIGSSIAGENAAPGGDTDHLIEFNAGNYNSIYKDSATTVNTQSIKQLVYIVVAK